MGVLIPFPGKDARKKAARVPARTDAPKGELVLFTGVRYERVWDEPKSPPSNSRHASNGVRRKRR